MKEHDGNSVCIPICACCKKIRDEDNQWYDLESFLAERFGFRFTHGLCPGCGAKIRLGLPHSAEEES